MTVNLENVQFRHLRFDFLPWDGPQCCPPGTPMTLMKKSNNNNKRMSLEDRFQKVYKDMDHERHKVVSPVGAVTLAYSPELNVVTMSLCDSKDKFCRKTGRKYAVQRLKDIATHGLDAEDNLVICVPERKHPLNTFHGNQMTEVIMLQVMKWAEGQARKFGNGHDSVVITHHEHKVVKD